jgi:hypothetical protein
MKASDVKFPKWLPYWARPIPPALREARAFAAQILGDRLEAATRIPGWLHPDQAALLSHLAHLCPAGPIVEIGSFRGKSTVFLASAMKETNSLTAIDPHQFSPTKGGGDSQADEKEGETSWEDFQRTLLAWGFDGVVKVVRDLSHAVAPNWNEPIAFLWIDGDHRYEGVSRDIADWVDFVMPGGFVGFHDTHSGHAGHGGPRRALRDVGYLADRGFETWLELRNAWFFRRRG